MKRIEQARLQLERRLREDGIVVPGEKDARGPRRFGRGGGPQQKLRLAGAQIDPAVSA